VIADAGRYLAFRQIFRRLWRAKHLQKYEADINPLRRQAIAPSAQCVFEMSGGVFMHFYNALHRTSCLVIFKPKPFS
jgi:hypothetical protein